MTRRAPRVYRVLVESVEALVDRIARESGFVGTVRVDVGDRTVVEHAFGAADRARGIPLTSDTRLGMASGSKAFTALAVMSLVEDGVLALDTTARELLGADLPLIADEVTVEQLLAHRSGIGDYLDDDADVSEYAMSAPVQLLTDMETFLPLLDGFPMMFPPDQEFFYCNGGFMVLALLAQRASGIDYHELVRERVLRPAVLADTEFLRSDTLPDRAALGYVEVDGEWRTNVFHLPVIGAGDGGCFTTVADMQVFWRSLFAGRIVSTETLAAMVAPRSTYAWLRYGLGFWLDGTSDTVFLEGEDAGVSFRSVHDPGDAFTYTVIGTDADTAWPLAKALDVRFRPPRP